MLNHEYTCGYKYDHLYVMLKQLFSVCVKPVAVDTAGDEAMADDDKLPTDGRDSGIGQSAASSSIPSVVIDHLSSGPPSRVQSGLVKSPEQGSHIVICSLL